MRPPEKRSVRWFQVRLPFLFLITIAIAAFFAGRAQIAENARRATAEAAAAHERSLHLEQVAGFWRNVALDSRVDLDNEVGMARRGLLSRHGFGESWVSRSRNESIRPRYDRWEIAFSEDEDQYSQQLDFYGVQLAAIWHNPPEVVVLSEFSEAAPESALDELPDNCLVMTADYMDYGIIERRVRQNGPDLVVRLLPKDFADQLAAAERKSLLAQIGSLENVERTRYAVESQKGGYRLEVVEQSLSAAAGR